MQSADENVFSLCDSEGNTVEIRSVLDSYGYSHDIAKVLGQGGQGVVCLTRNPEIVIKFALDSKGRLICRDKNKEAFLNAKEVLKDRIAQIDSEINQELKLAKRRRYEQELNALNQRYFYENYM